MGFIFPAAEWEAEGSVRSDHFGSTYTKIGTIQRTLAWPLPEEDMLTFSKEKKYQARHSTKNVGSLGLSQPFSRTPHEGKGKIGPDTAF